LKLTTDFHLVPKIRMRRAILPLPRIFVVWCLMTYRENLHASTVNIDLVHVSPDVDTVELSQY